MGCKGRARPLHARASGTSTRTTCAFHEHGTCALHTARPSARARRAFPQRIQLTGTSHRNRRKNKDDAKPLHNRERQPLRESKNKNPRIFATFFRLGTPSRPCKAKIGSFMANYPRFHAPTRDMEPRNNPQSQKSCNSNRFFVFELPGRLPDDAMGRVAFRQCRGRQTSRSVTRQPGCSIVGEGNGARSAPSGAVRPQCP